MLEILKTMFWMCSEDNPNRLWRGGSKLRNAIIAILKQLPELADEWIEDEKINGKHTYFDVSIETLLNLSKQPKKQYDLFDIEPAFNCACGA